MMEDNYILVSLNANWADEFDVNSLWVTTQNEYKKVIEGIDKYFIEDVEFYFGTNEYVSFTDKEEILDSIRTEPISKNFYEEFIRLIGETYGLVSLPEMLETFKEVFENEQ